MLKKIVLLMLVLSLPFSMTSCFFEDILNAEHEDYFKSWVPEKDADVAICDGTLGVLILNGETINVKPFFDQITGVDTLDQLLCVSDNKIYGMHPEVISEGDYMYKQNIFSLDISTGEYEELYTFYHHLRDDSERDSKVNYHLHEWYYLDREMYFCDGLSAVKYNIDSCIFQTYETCICSQLDLDFPYSIEHIRHPVSDYWHELKITKGDTERMITREYLATKNKYIKDLDNLKNRQTIFGSDDPFKGFIGETYVINGKIYLRCSIYGNFLWEYCMIFSYDFESETVEYLYTTSSNTYYTVVIPVE